jgi:peroxiredoxin
MSALSLALLVSLPGLTPPGSPTEPIGPVIGDFALRDHQGVVHRLSDRRDHRAVVVVFLGVDCPLAKLYAPRLGAMARAFEKRGVAFLAVAPNRHDSRADLARYARQHALPFPLLKDVGHAIADRFAAQRSPEVFVLDARRAVRYRGRIDDQYTTGGHRPRATRQDLKEALEEVLAGKPVRVPLTPAGGCPISRARPPKPASTVTYHRDVAPILQKRCQVCHRPGQVAPFALTSFKEARAWAGAICEVVEDGRMPPWSADPRHGKWANDPSLTAAEKQALRAWARGRCPEGDPKDAPPKAKFPTGWSIPGPDLVVQMPDSFTVPAEGVIEYQYFVVDPGFTEDRWVRAAQIMPGNRAVVHHCNVFLQPPGSTDPTDVRPAGALGSYCLTMTAPGTPPMIFGDGLAKRIPAGWKLVFVVHYTAIGSVQKDRTRLGLTFADPKTVKKEVATQLMFDLDLAIPPGAANHEVSQTWAVQRDVDLLALFPHMHLRGKSFRYTAIHPDGSEEILLDVPRYDFNWQHRYVFAQPKRLPAGSRLRCTAVYDNSTDNAANPDPAVTVRAGPQSWDEMFNGYFDVVLADEDRTAPVPWQVQAWQAAQGVFRPPVAVLLCLVVTPYLLRRRIARWLGDQKRFAANASEASGSG